MSWFLEVVAKTHDELKETIEYRTDIPGSVKVEAYALIDGMPLEIPTHVKPRDGVLYLKMAGHVSNDQYNTSNRSEIDVKWIQFGR
jgi:hypothetical protein